MKKMVTERKYILKTKHRYFLHKNNLIIINTSAFTRHLQLTPRKCNKMKQ